MFCPFFFLFMLTGGVGVLAVFGWRLVTAHLRQNPEAAKLISEHVITPLLIGKQEPRPEPKKIKSTLV